MDSGTKGDQAHAAAPLISDHTSNARALAARYFLDHAKAERKAIVQPHCLTDHLGREAMAGIGGLGGWRTRSGAGREECGNRPLGRGQGGTLARPEAEKTDALRIQMSVREALNEGAQP